MDSHQLERRMHRLVHKENSSDTLKTSSSLASKNTGDNISKKLHLAPNRNLLFSQPIVPYVGHEVTSNHTFHTVLHVAAPHTSFQFDLTGRDPAPQQAPFQSAYDATENTSNGLDYLRTHSDGLTEQNLYNVNWHRRYHSRALSQSSPNCATDDTPNYYNINIGSSVRFVCLSGGGSHDGGGSHEGSQDGEVSEDGGVSHDGSTVSLHFDSILSQIKRTLPIALLEQLHNVSLSNMCRQEHFPDSNACLSFAEGFGMVGTVNSDVRHCNGNFCRVLAEKKARSGFVYICRNKKPFKKERCLATISPLKNTFFEEARLTIHDIFTLIMCFVSKLTVTHVVQQTGIGKKTVIDWFVYCREVCEVILANEFDDKIGGEGMIVEVDESHLFRRKYGVGRIRKWEDKWLLGCYCRETQQCRIVQVENRKRSTIMPLLLKFIDSKSTIFTDFAKVYEGCEKFGFHAHAAVCHKRYFVCPKDSNVYTNTIEATWRWRKKDVRSCGDEDCIDRYLAESEYRHRYFRNIDMAPLSLDDQFLLFMYHIKLVYPGPGKVGLTFPRIDSAEDDDSSNDDSTTEPPFKQRAPPLKSPANVSQEPHSISTAPPLSSPANSVHVLHNATIEPTSESAYPVSMFDCDSNLHQRAKALTHKFIVDCCNFSCASLTSQLFSLNEQTFSEMLAALRSAKPQNYHESSMKVDKALLEHLHPAFKQVFACVETPAKGNCFYGALSIALFGDSRYMELVRLCTAFVLNRYHDVFLSAMHAMSLTADFTMNEPMHFLTVGAATPSYLLQRILDLNVGKNWDNHRGTLCWASNLTILASSIACQRPFFIYNTFLNSEGRWRHPLGMTVEQLDSRSDVGGSVTAGHWTVLGNDPCRLFLHENHFSAVVPVVSTLPVPLKPFLLNSIPNFTLHVADKL